MNAQEILDTGHIQTNDSAHVVDACFSFTVFGPDADVMSAGDKQIVKDKKERDRRVTAAKLVAQNWGKDDAATKIQSQYR